MSISYILPSGRMNMEHFQYLSPYQAHYLTQVFFLLLVFCFLAVLKTSSSNRPVNNNPKTHVGDLSEGELLLQVIGVSVRTNIIFMALSYQKVNTFFFQVFKDSIYIS